MAKVVANLNTEGGLMALLVRALPKEVIEGGIVNAQVGVVRIQKHYTGWYGSGRSTAINLRTQDRVQKSKHRFVNVDKDGLIDLAQITAKFLELKEFGEAEQKIRLERELERQGGVIKLNSVRTELGLYNEGRALTIGRSMRLNQTPKLMYPPHIPVEGGQVLFTLDVIGLTENQARTLVAFTGGLLGLEMTKKEADNGEAKQD